MTYLDVYKKRASYLGKTPQERAFQSGIIEFRRYLKYNQHKVTGLIRAKDNTVFEGVILTDKEDENRVSQQLLVELTTELDKGDLIIWNNDYWLIYQSTTSSYQPYQKFYMVKCNYYIKWIDSGELHESWCYLLGSKDSKIKDNFRTWHNVITPQPNKYISIIMPHAIMPLKTEIIVLDEAWYLVDFDQNSVPGVIFMSFTESNVNLQRDDIENKIANKDQLASWRIIAADEQTVTQKSEVKIDYFIFKNGILQENINDEVSISVSGNLYFKNDKVYAASAGTGYITFTYKDESFVQKIIITEEEKQNYFIIGNDKIKVGYNDTYSLYGADGEVAFYISDKKLATIKNCSLNSCNIYSNEDNKLGTIVLTAVYEGNEYTKEIQIIPLWQVTQ